MNTTDQYSIHLPIIDPHEADRDPAGYFATRSAVKAFDLKHRGVLRKAIGNYNHSVDLAKKRFLDHEDARRRAAAIKRDAIENLDKYLEEFEANVKKRGGQVHWAETAEDVRRIILKIAADHKVSHVVKGKSMATEEVHLNDAFEEAGIEPVETDLGEYICQLRGEPPYHIVTPVMHLTKGDIADTFEEKLQIERTEVAEELTMIARERLRSRFVSAVMGITGGNFLVADVGMVAITENEGNARLSFSLPDVHVALVGIEKILPRLEDLGLLWPMLATSGTGQHLTCYNSLIGAAKKEGEIDGPSQFHVVLMDNGRTRLLADPEQREAAQCIRCGACLNACPIFKNVGGHTYGTTYQGPIGSVITPHLRGLKEWKHLPYASSLCGNCTEVCPVKIDIHHHLLHNRRNAVERGYSSRWEKHAFQVWLWFMMSTSRYRIAGKLARVGEWFFNKLRIAEHDALNPIQGWTKSRVLPALAKQSFRDWWDEVGGQDESRTKVESSRN
ncbi:MAG: LutB/LldF family L-lactate oxidation iron-sulfur protein [Planctomycetota bacterium]